MSVYVCAYRVGTMNNGKLEKIQTQHSRKREGTHRGAAHTHSTTRRRDDDETRGEDDARSTSIEESDDDDA